MDNKSRKNKNKYFVLALYIAIVIAAIVLLILPATFFDKGQSICLSVLVFNKQCFGCGMTRAIQHLIHLDFKAAYEYNKLSFIVLPLFVFMIAWEFKKFWMGIKDGK